MTLPGWQVISHGDWDLHTSHPLPVIDIADRHGRIVGWLLGHAIHDVDGVISHEVRLPICAESSTGSAVNAVVEHWSRSAGGRYLVIMLVSEARIYPDAGAFLPAYRCSRSGAVGSSPQLVEMVAGSPGHDALHEEMRFAMEASRQTAWFPFGLTPCPTVSRLLPNHHLRLRDGETIRYWRPPSRDADYDNSVDAIVTTLRTQTQHVLDYSPCYPSLTAGYDSGLVLAACRSNIARLICYTVNSGQADGSTAKQLSTQIGVRHVVLKRLPPRPGDREAWLQRTGSCIVGDGAGSTPRRPSLDITKAVLGGFGGEVRRGFYWGRAPSLEAPLDADG